MKKTNWSKNKRSISRNWKWIYNSKM